MKYKTKIVVLLLSIALIPALLVGGFAYDAIKNTLESRVISAHHMLMDKKVDVIQAELELYKNTVVFLSELPPIQGLIRSQITGRDTKNGSSYRQWTNRLESIFSSLMISDEKIQRIHFISAKGTDKVVSLRTGNQVSKVSGKHLVYRGDEEYFIGGKDLDKGDIYLSNIRLNRVQGQLVVPYEPLLSFSTPVFNEQTGRFSGMIVVDLNINHLSGIVRKNLSMGEIFLSDHKGNYIIHPDSEKQFSSDLKTGHTFQSDYSLGSELESHNEEVSLDINHAGETLFINKIKYDDHNDEHLWHLVSAIDDADLFKDIRSFLVTFFSGFVILIFIIIIFSRYVALRLTRPFEELTNASKLVEEGDYSNPFETIRKDEVGEIQAQLNKMVGSIKEKNDQFEMLMFAIDEACLVGITDKKGKIIYVNNHFCEVSGYSKEELIGNDHRLVNSGYHSKEVFADMWRTVLREKKTWRDQIKNKAKDGSYYWVDATVTPLLDEAGEVDQIIAIRYLITEQKENELEIQKKSELLELDDWIKSHQASFVNIFQTENDFDLVLRKIITEIAEAVKAAQGAFYIKDDTQSTFVLRGTYAYTKRKGLSTHFAEGEGIIGQVALEKKPIILSQVPADYVHIQSGLGEAVPKLIYAYPIVFEEKVLAVMELSAFESFDPKYEKLVEEVSLSLGIVLNSFMERLLTERLLIESQEMSEKLKEQSEELQAANEELEEKSEELQTQTEELQAANEEMEEKSEELKQQKEYIEKKNVEILESQEDLKKKGKELERASRYKSEFLANMSHELRTPLNSLLILSKSLSDNDEKNLTKDQLEATKIIHGGGIELLELINDILDLSKVEAGRLDIHIEETPVTKITDAMALKFNHVAEGKGLRLDIKLGATVPACIPTDSQRVEQILKNLLSNALKFTETGSVTMDIKTVTNPAGLKSQALQNKPILAFSVIDTGIGISQKKLELIFSAFQQADGSTSRKYGGTGLGLTISKELCRLLGGELAVTSEDGKGSVFTLYLPTALSQMPVAEDSVLGEGAGNIPDFPVFLEDDREVIYATRKPSVLVIEDDISFSKILAGVIRKKGYLGVLAGQGLVGIEMAKYYQPKAIILDMGLPDIDGEEVLRRLKTDDKTRSIPVHIISGRESSDSFFKQGAVSFLQKPIDIDVLNSTIEGITQGELSESSDKKILIVEDHEGTLFSLKSLLKDVGSSILSSGTGQEALAVLSDQDVDIIILDLNLPDISGFELLEEVQRIKSEKMPRIIIYSGRELEREEYNYLRGFTGTIIVKGTNSEDRLMDEVSLFLSSVKQALPTKEQPEPQLLHSNSEVLKGKHVLLVDDDLRNTFALSSVLKKMGLDVEMADNGKMALEYLINTPKKVDVVLMDIMMPIMDGYEAMREIRKIAKFQTLPIIALTAKAMPEDRAKCINAGASDYLTKPVDVDKLKSSVQLWITKVENA